MFQSLASSTVDPVSFEVGGLKELLQVGAMRCADSKLVAMWGLMAPLLGFQKAIP